MISAKSTYVYVKPVYCAKLHCTPPESCSYKLPCVGWQCSAIGSMNSEGVRRHCVKYTRDWWTDWGTTLFLSECDDSHPVFSQRKLERRLILAAPSAGQWPQCCQPAISRRSHITGPHDGTRLTVSHQNNPICTRLLTYESRHIHELFTTLNAAVFWRIRDEWKQQL